MLNIFELSKNQKQNCNFSKESIFNILEEALLTLPLTNLKELELKLMDEVHMLKMRGTLFTRVINRQGAYIAQLFKTG